MDHLISVKSAYEERNNFILIALTGRTGAGCSTTASILRKPRFEDLDLKTPKTLNFESVDERKYNILYHYAQAGHWQGFDVIEASSVIFSYILESGLHDFKEYMRRFKEVNKENHVRINGFPDLQKKIDGLEDMFTEYQSFQLHGTEDLPEDKAQVDSYYNFYLNRLPALKRQFAEMLNQYTCCKEFESRFAPTKLVKTHLYTHLMQEIGNNLRASGKPYVSTYSQKDFYCVAKRIDSIIQIIRLHNNLGSKPVPTRVCIDAIRNPYEALYFKDKYSAFYLISLSTDEYARRSRLGHLDSEELSSLDSVEDPSKPKEDYEIFFHQNISACLEIADIHLYNPQQKDGKYFFLTEQIMRYVCLMVHPGLITPTHIEWCMQLATTVKLNSGCLSRQVGAVITDKSFSVKAVGWNDVPAGQTPCNFRDVNGYCMNKDPCTYSTFETESSAFSAALDAMQQQLKTTKGSTCGRTMPFCFKDVYNGMRGDNNQVHTRALHAEENAFLQLCKYGGEGIQGGRLFVTASPCELCSKKSYQLGIKDIYYIDAYPGISFEHILKQNPDRDPELHLFYGAIGSAYVTLYGQRMSVKDELALMTGVKGKDVKKYMTASAPSQGKFRWKDQVWTLTFESRESITAREEHTVVAVDSNLTQLAYNRVWTGSSFEGTELIECKDKNGKEWPCDWSVTGGKPQPYIETLTLKKPLKRGQEIRYITKTSVKDVTHIMNPFYANIIRVPTEHLIIRIRTRTKLLNKVHLAVYADLEMSPEMLVGDKCPLSSKRIGDFYVYEFELTNPNLNYSYCIEWSFSN